VFDWVVKLLFWLGGIAHCFVLVLAADSNAIFRATICLFVCVFMR
jgi:hypothetical protein